MVGFVVLNGISLVFFEKQISNPTEALYVSVVVDGETKYKTESSPFQLELSWDLHLKLAAHSWSTVTVLCWVDEVESHPISSRLAWASFQASDMSGARNRLITFKPPEALCGDVSLRIKPFDEPISFSVPSLTLPSLPSLSSWIDMEEDREADAVWKSILPYFSSQGYDILLNWLPPSGGKSPIRSFSLSPPKDPFQPNDSEMFIHWSPSQEDDVIRRAWLTMNNIARQAYDRRNRLVVVKAVEKDSAEIDILRFLNSPALRSYGSNHTIPFIDVIEAEGCSFLVEPWWEMHPFDIHVWQVDDYFARTVQTLEALSFLHEHRIFHRDFSSANIVGNHDAMGITAKNHLIPVPIFSTFDMRVGIIDFGISKQYPEDTPLSDCVANEYCGTAPFIAPEVVERLPGAAHEGKDYLLGPVDVYGFGAMALEALVRERRTLQIMEESCGYAPYEGTHAISILDELVPQYKRLLEELTDADPLRRPSASEALQKFRDLRTTVPDSVLIAPEGGYPKDLSGLREVMHA
ncbi:kinase-like protein [Auriscalpium vulgare]|uniref:Kinase-like protein n=1 Tax=Auriscalpium vulgare TaxID=40419 RepID=A0ACB8S2U6_9AGAM|nr:kinase-like protein [Auriscalpium vulgare]